MITETLYALLALLLLAFNMRSFSLRLAPRVGHAEPKMGVSAGW